MGTHPIFESDFDCLTDDMASSKSSEVKPFDHTIIIMDASNNVPLLKFETCPPDIRPFCVDKIPSKMTPEERRRFRSILEGLNPKIIHVKNISVIFQPKFKTVSQVSSTVGTIRNITELSETELKKGASKRTRSQTHASSEADKVKKIKIRKITSYAKSPPDSTKTSLEINSRTTQTQASVKKSQKSQTFHKSTSKSSQVSSLTRSYDTQTDQLVTKSQNTQTSLDSTSKSTQVSPSNKSESTQTAENQSSEIFAVQGENAKLKYQLLFNICNTLTEKLERQAEEIEKLERQAEKFAAQSEKISKLESEVQTLRTAQTLN